MFSHAVLGVSDFQRALGFYRPLLSLLGWRERFCDAEQPWAGWQPAQGARPLLVIARPFDGGRPAPGNGAMLALNADCRALVRAAHAMALAHGGSDEGSPGLRPHYHEGYYGAYFRDPDGNKLCVVCHDLDALP